MTPHNSMPPLDAVTEADIRQLLSTKIRSRAIGYLNYVETPVRRGNQLTAVIGQGRQYQVHIETGANGISSTCTCSDDWNGHCKHVGALLFYWVRYPTRFDNQTGMHAPALELVHISADKSSVPKTPPAWSQATFAQRQQQARAKLSEQLQRETVNQLRAIGKARGGRLKGAKKGEIVAQLVERLLDSAETLNAYHSLTQPERAFLYTLLVIPPGRSFNDSSLQLIMRQWGEPIKTKNLYSSVAAIQKKGLVLSSGADGSQTILKYGHVSPLTARDLLYALPPILPTLEGPTAQELHLASGLELVRTINYLAEMLTRTKFTLNAPQPRPKLAHFYKALRQWTYDENELETLSHTGKLSKSRMPTMSVPPPPYSISHETLIDAAGGQVRLEWCYRLMVAVGILCPGSPIKLWKTYQHPFYQLSERQQHAALVRAYLRMSEWNELWDLLHAEPKLKLKRRPLNSYEPAAFASELSLLRHMVLHVLATLPDRQWVSIHALTSLLRRMWKQFTASELRPVYYGSKSTTSIWHIEYEGKVADKWGIPQKRFVQQILQMLHELGIADLGKTKGDIVEFCLHGLGDLFWDRAETVSTTANDALQEQTIIADALEMDEGNIRVNPSKVSAKTHRFLESIAQLEQATPNAFVYQLDPHTVHQLFESGTSLNQLIAGWEAQFGTPPPEPITNRLAAWWDSYGQIRLYENVTLIEFIDEFALREMKAITKLNDHIIAELSSTLVMIQADAVDTLSAQLQQAGYTPKLTDQPS